MPQDTFFQVFKTAVRVDKASVFCHGHRIDGEVSPQEILLQRDGRVSKKSKAFIPVSAFSFSPRKGIFFVCPRMQKHRKIITDGNKL